MTAAAIQLPTAERGSGLLQRLLLPNPRFDILTSTAPDRQLAEQYIANHFAQEYSAQITHFLPKLLTMSCSKKHYSAAVGIRQASIDPLFLEQYINKPIEMSIAAQSGTGIMRQHIAEVGNLVASQRGASYLLFVLCAAILYKANIQWMVFTATEQVSHILKRLKFNTYTLGDADPNKLTSDSEQNNWGTYYNKKPKVLAGDLKQAHRLIKENKLLNHIVEHYADYIQQLAMQIR